MICLLLISPGKSKMLFLYPCQRCVSLKGYLSEVSSKGDAIPISDLKKNLYNDNPQQVILILSKSLFFPKV